MVRVKICGITNEADMLAAIEAGADFLGFIFHEKSPRYVSPAQVAALTGMLPGLDVPRVPLCVGVFVSPTPDEVAEVVERCKLGAAQVHRADPVALRAIHERLQGALYPGIQPQTFEEGLAAIKAATTNEAETMGVPPWLPQLLVDAHHPDLAGGTGRRADFALAGRLAAAVDRMMLAGGLTPENVMETIRAVRPWAVDVSSGVEAAPGRKDHARIRAFIQAARAADNGI
jgi:phosphoribosylanthranilate isomerase